MCALEDIIQALFSLVIQKAKDKEFFMLYSKPDVILADTHQRMITFVNFSDMKSKLDENFNIPLGGFLSFQ